MNGKKSLRQVRFFSEAVKRHVVTEIEKGKINVASASREYCVSSTTIYKWLTKYSRNLQSSKRIVVEMQSESKKSEDLQKRVLELEAALGRKQMEVDVLNRLIDVAKEELGVDIKKNISTQPSNGSEETKGNTATK